MRTILTFLSSAALAVSLTTALGCHAQVPAGQPLTPELSRRVEILIRDRTRITPDYEMKIGPRMHSDMPGFDQIEVTFSAEGNTSKPLAFLISTDGKQLAQFNKYDLTKDPKTVVSGAGRPARGGPEGAPVEIVGFDDLECPYCARMNAQLFPAITERYGKSVRIVYKDFPITQHPWAMRAAVDTNCLGTQNASSYWTMVDYIHAHAAELGGTEKSLQKANDTLDQLALDQSKKDNLKVADVEACVKKQDDAMIKTSMKVGEDLGVEATPVLFINGEKLEGAYPLTDVYRMIDQALIAAGQTPPAPYVPPAAPKPSH